MIQHFGEMWKSGTRGQNEGGFPTEQGFPIKNGCHWGGCGGGEDSLWHTSWFSALDNTVVLAQFAVLAHALARRKIMFHLIAHTISGVIGVF
jgi:hypothetical protein